MRIKIRFITFSLITFNLILVYFTWNLFRINLFYSKNPISPITEKPKQKDRMQSTNKHIKKTVTIIFREFFHFENDLKPSIDSILNLIPNIQIYIISNEVPYPPWDYNFSNYTIKNNVKFIYLNFDIRKTWKASTPLLQIKTKYILFLPDSIRFSGRSIIEKLIKDINMDATTASAVDNVVLTNHEKKKNDKTSHVDTGVGAANSNIKIHDGKHITKNQKKMLIIPFISNDKIISNCCKIKLDFANWTMEYNVKNGTGNCDMFLQKHAILIETVHVKEMPDALAQPFPEIFYIQAKLAKIKKIFSNSTFHDGKRLFTAYHNKERKNEIRKLQFKNMYKRLQMKKVIRKLAGNIKNNKVEKIKHPKNYGKNNSILSNSIIDDGHITLYNNSLPLITTIEYYGCERNTKSCVGSVFNLKPFYTFLQKHTPPCCLEKLKLVFNHVLDEFENVGIRYWLDNVALKSAIDTNGLSIDAYEIDISFNLNDLERSVFLKKSQTRPLADASGFYWIKATDGHYFHVQYSKINQIGVNLLPHEIENNRVIPSGFYGWKAKEFSTEFLHPMSTVFFLGKNVMCPNNVREYLEFKNKN